MIRIFRLSLFLAGLLPFIVSAQPKPQAPSILPVDARIASIQKELLHLLVRANSAEELLAKSSIFVLADRDLQRLYYTKLYGKQASPSLEKELLNLMPQGAAEAGQFYVFTYLRSGSAPDWIKQDEALQASNLHYEYYSLVSTLVLKHPEFLSKYLVMLHWANVEVSEMLDEKNEVIKKSLGAKFLREDERVKKILAQ
jgi:hypothetical protein